MTLPLLAIIVGLLLLIWGADKFVEGAAATAQNYGMPSLLIGMIIVGLGTSAPEMVVSTFAALEGSPGLALGNAFGSNIANITLILGGTAIISPILVKSSLMRKELPLLSLITLMTGLLMMDAYFSYIDALILLGIFMITMGWSLYSGIKNNDSLKENINYTMSKGKAFFWLGFGLMMLIVSSKVLVWGCVEIAYKFGVSDTIIGLTIVAVGTSLPELASTFAAARKNEHDIALGNIIGSNFFNTLVVIGIAGIIKPFSIEKEILWRDLPLMTILTLSLFLFAAKWKKKDGKISRAEGIIYVLIYAGYTVYLISTITHT